MSRPSPVNDIHHTSQCNSWCESLGASRFGRLLAIVDNLRPRQRRPRRPRWIVGCWKLGALKTEHTGCVARHISCVGEVIQAERSPQISSRSEVLDAGGFSCLVAGGGLSTLSTFLTCSP